MPGLAPIKRRDVRTRQDNRAGGSGIPVVSVDARLADDPSSMSDVVSLIERFDKVFGRSCPVNSLRRFFKVTVEMP